MKRLLLDLTREELEIELKPSFRAKQIFKWVYQNYVDDFEQMLNLPKNMREELSEKFSICNMSVAREQKSLDGSVKLLFKLHDGQTVESVLLPMKEEVVEEEGRI